VALDGYTLRGVRGEAIAGVHLVAAYAHRAAVVLGQLRSADYGHGLAAAQQVGNDTVITAGTNSVTLLGVNLGSLQQSDFVIVA
jgi:predicted metalloprotease